MKQKGISRFITSLGLGWIMLIGFLGQPHPAAAQGPLDNTFTFQGRLRLTGSTYVTGQACDFRFSLWDVPSGGATVGIPLLDRPNIPVQDGYFSVDLDFGPVFDGNQRYLQIEVACPAGSGTYSPLGQRAKLNPIPYTVYAPNYSGGADWSQLTGKPVGFADDVDNLGVYTSGYGLALNSTQLSVITTTLITPSLLQLQIGSGCVPGQTIRVVNTDGTVVCRASNNSYQAGDGLKMDRSDAQSHPILEPDYDVIQERVDSTLCGSAGSGQGIRKILPTGEVECEASPGGDIEAVYAGPGLAGSGTSGVITLTVATGGIVDTMLAVGSISTTKLVTGAVTASKLYPGSVNSSVIADGGVQLGDINQNFCLDGQTMLYNGLNWACGDDTPSSINPGAGISALSPNTLQVKVRNGLTIAADKVAANFLQANTPTASGNGGSDTTAARSDHTHDDRYVQDSSNYTGDAAGNFASGFTVTGLQGWPVAAAGSGNNTVLIFNGTQWVNKAYGFPLNFSIQEYSRSGGNDSIGEAFATCPADRWLVGGGCRCAGSGDDRQVEASFPEGSSTWRCDCNNGGATAAGNNAYARCLKKAYE